MVVAPPGTWGAKVRPPGALERFELLTPFPVVDVSPPPSTTTTAQKKHPNQQQSNDYFHPKYSNKVPTKHPEVIRTHIFYSLILEVP